MNSPLQFHVYRRDYDMRVGVIAHIPDIHNNIGLVAQPVKYDMVEKDDLKIFDPTLDFSADEAKSLMTALWNAGVRPHKFSSPDGEIARIEAHLQDMRTLVFKDKA